VARRRPALPVSPRPGAPTRTSSGNWAPAPPPTRPHRFNSMTTLPREQTMADISAPPVWPARTPATVRDIMRPPAATVESNDCSSQLPYARRHATRPRGAPAEPVVADLIACDDVSCRLQEVRPHAPSVLPAQMTRYSRLRTRLMDGMSGNLSAPVPRIPRRARPQRRGRGRAEFMGRKR
jgi:hypothetical protein